jgi:NADP-dependent 3-hydroxy acid dehydrogenase YdfG
VDDGGDLINISSVAGRTARRPTGSTPPPSGGSTAGWSRCAKNSQPDIRVTVVEPGAVGTELTDHITHAATKEATEQFVKEMAIRPEDIADVIAFAVSRPRRMTLNEILVRPTAQAG